jgi:hypothetical protein
MNRLARTILLGVLLATAGTTTRLAAQQPGAPGRVMESTSLSGPRLRAEWPRFDPTESSTLVRPLLASGGSDHTFVFSTLALVLIGVIVLLLVM